MTTDLEGYPRTVWSEDNPELHYVVSGLCKKCVRIDKGEWERPWLYNIYTTKMHFQGEDEYTLCGVSATESQWLWQL